MGTFQSRWKRPAKSPVLQLCTELRSDAPSPPSPLWVFCRPVDCWPDLHSDCPELNHGAGPKHELGSPSKTLILNPVQDIWLRVRSRERYLMMRLCRASGVAAGMHNSIEEHQGWWCVALVFPLSSINRRPTSSDSDPVPSQTSLASFRRRGVSRLKHGRASLWE